MKPEACEACSYSPTAHLLLVGDLGDAVDRGLALAVDPLAALDRTAASQAKKKKGRGWDRREHRAGWGRNAKRRERASGYRKDS